MLAKLSVLLKTIFLFTAFCFLLISLTVDFSNTKPYILNRASSSHGQPPNNAEKPFKETATDSGLALLLEKTTAVIDNASPTNFPHLPSTPALKNGNATLLRAAPPYIKAIMDPEDTTFPRLECPIPNDQRYRYLKANPPHTRHKPTAPSRPTYFFALNIHQRASLLPSLFGAIVEAMRFLGPQSCALSVVEGRSDDGTYEILVSLREEIECLGAKYYLSSSDLDPEASDRIRPGARVEVLAELRNQALEPLMDLHHQGSPADGTTIIFLNDVAICSEDILELIHQRQYQEADMVCGMDWTYVAPDPTFYDVWIARDMNGDTFFEIPPNGSWDAAWDIFWNNPWALEHIWMGKPFQVFSCWNGAAAFTAAPYLESGLRFRRAREHECPQGEPKTWCADFWRLGHGRIAVVPIVNVEYSDEAAMYIKDAKGYVSNWMGGGGEADERIVWDPNPPALVRCMPNYDNQTWVPWNQG